MPQKRMSPSRGDTISATVLRYTDHAICRQLCSPSPRSSSMTVCRYMPTSAHWGGPRWRSMQQNMICGLAQSGTCTTYIDRKAVQSCVIRISASAREGLDAPGPCYGCLVCRLNGAEGLE